MLPIAELARGWLSAFGNGTHGFVYGVVLVLVVLFFPRGLVGQLGGRRDCSWIDRLPGVRAGARRVVAAPCAAACCGSGVAGQPILEAERASRSASAG